MSTVHTNREHVVCYDCDDTLVMWHKDVNDVYVKDPYDNAEVLLKRHEKHIKLLKDHKARGYYVCVWSAGGYMWAKAVVKALELENYVDHIMAKPLTIVDDLPVEAWMGKRVYLEDKDDQT